MTGLLIGVYAGLVLLSTQVFRFADPVAVAASTLAAAALFNPVRRRVQSAVDRRFNRARYDADQMLAAFAARLKDAADLEPVQTDLAPTIRGASGRVALPSPDQVPVGRSDPPWPTPAECYLAALAPVTTISIGTSGTLAEAGPEETAGIVATVADSLIAVGALPVTSTLLREFPGSVPGWHAQLAHRWGRRAKATEQRAPVRRHITGDYGPLMTQPETALSHSSWTI